MSTLTKTQHRTLLLAIDLMEQARTRIEEVRIDLQSSYDELSEDAQTSSSGETLSETIDELDDALGNLENAISNVPSEEPT